MSKNHKMWWETSTRPFFKKLELIIPMDEHSEI